VLGIAQTPATTQAAASISPAKIAWMNLQQALLTTDEGKSMYADLQKYIEDKQKEMDGLRKEGDTLKSKLEVQRTKLSDEALAKLEEEIDAKDTAIQRFQQDTQKDIESKQARMTNYLGKKMQSVIDKICKEKGIGALLIINQQRDAFIDTSLIITEELVKAYNKEYAAGAAKAPAAAPAAPAKKP
jgi:outer membrane protein